MKTHSHRLLALSVLSTTVLASGSAALGAPAWYGVNGGFIANGGAAISVPDFYQHQNWVSSGASGVNNTNGWQTTTGSPGGATGGWCNYTAYADIFYDFYARGITGVYPNAVNPITSPYNSLYGPTNSAANVVNSNIYQIRGAMGPTTAKNVQTFLTAQSTGLLSNAYTIGTGAAGTVSGRAYYNDPTTGALRSLNMNAFDATNLWIKHFNANIVYTLLPGSASTAKTNGQGLWWNFHNVAVAGINPTTGLVYVADPDSNLGPGVANAGWPHTDTRFPSAAPFSLTSAAGSPRPVPAAPNVATPASYNANFDAFAFGVIPNAPGVIGPPVPIAGNGVGSFDAPQYNNTTLDRINVVMENPIRQLFRNFRLAANSQPAVETTVAITLPTGGDAVDGFFLEPTSASLDPATDPSFFGATSSNPGSIFSVPAVSSIDPIGNLMANPGIRFDVIGSPVLPGDIVNLKVGTLGDFFLTGFNVLFHFVGDANDVWLSAMQGGTLFNPSDTATDQTILFPVPEPASFGMLGISAAMLLLRRRR